MGELDLDLVENRLPIKSMQVCKILQDPFAVLDGEHVQKLGLLGHRSIGFRVQSSGYENAVSFLGSSLGIAAASIPIMKSYPLHARKKTALGPGVRSREALVG